MTSASPSLHTIPASYALLMLEVVQRLGISGEAYLAEVTPLLEERGLTIPALMEPAARIPLDLLPQGIAAAIRLTDEPGFAFHVGMQMKLSSHGFVGFAAMTAHNVGEAIAIAERFVRLRVPGVSLQLHVEGDLASIVLKDRIPPGWIREFGVIALFVGLAQMGEVVTGVRLEGTADVTFDEPEYFSRFQQLLPGSVNFNKAVDRLVFPASYLQLPLKLSDPAAMQLARDQCERELQAMGSANRQLARVRSLSFHESAGFRSLEQVADMMHVSPRTLKRQLAQQGTSFSKIVEEARRQKALLLLEQRDLSIERIADRLGYSDVANFTRAFKRWTGQTPTAYRTR